MIGTSRSGSSLFITYSSTNHRYVCALHYLRLAKVSILDQSSCFHGVKLLSRSAMPLPEGPNPMLTECVATDHLPPTRPKILLVDDDKDDRFLTRKSLESKNCEVVTATSVTEAFKQIATQCFDVLITDLHMPGAGDGFALVTAMRHFQPEALTLARIIHEKWSGV
jgi:hypothetical protein